MSFPKKGKFFPGQDWGANGGESPDGRRYAAEIAAALHRALDSTRAGAKTAAGWTGADERTAKNWLSGRYGPSGMHLVALARNSEDVLNAFSGDGGAPGFGRVREAGRCRTGNIGAVVGGSELEWKGEVAVSNSEVHGKLAGST